MRSENLDFLAREGQVSAHRLDSQAGMRGEDEDEVADAQPGERGRGNMKNAVFLGQAGDVGAFQWLAPTVAGGQADQTILPDAVYFGVVFGQVDGAAINDRFAALGMKRDDRASQGHGDLIPGAGAGFQLLGVVENEIAGANLVGGGKVGEEGAAGSVAHREEEWRSARS